MPKVYGTSLNLGWAIFRALHRPGASRSRDLSADIDSLHERCRVALSAQRGQGLDPTEAAPSRVHPLSCPVPRHPRHLSQIIGTPHLAKGY